MAKADTSRIEALEAVLAEKRKHEGYLAKLEERRATTPANVFARLRDEYLTKLTDLQVRASIESESLSESLKEDEAAVADIEAKLAAITEERLEGELRAEVGEYDPKEWGEKLKSLNAGVSKIEKERDLRVASFERTRALLIEARGSLPVPAAAAEPEPVAVVAAEPPRISSPTPVGRPTPHAIPAPPATSARTSAAEAMPAVSAVAAAPAAARIVTPVPPPPVVRAPTPAAPVPAVPAEAISMSNVPEPSSEPAAEPAAAPAQEPVAESPSAEAPAAAKPAPGPMAGSPSFDELAFLNSVVGRASTPMRAEPPSPRQSRPMNEVRDSAKTPMAPAVQVPRATTAKVTEPVEEEAGPLGRPTPRTSQAIKTLKCQECGTLNYPTEWYCERCGGELAAL